jgi:hypothetical protein
VVAAARVARMTWRRCIADLPVVAVGARPSS